MTQNILYALVALGSVWIVTCFVLVFALTRAASRPMPQLTFADQLEQPMPQPRSEAREASLPVRQGSSPQGEIHPVHPDPIHAHAVGT